MNAAGLHACACVCVCGVGGGGGVEGRDRRSYAKNADSLLHSNSSHEQQVRSNSLLSNIFVDSFYFRRTRFVSRLKQNGS